MGDPKLAEIMRNMNIPAPIEKNRVGPTSGKKATHYVANAPDGTVIHKKSFKVHSDVAVMGLYQHNGKWYAAGVTDCASSGSPGLVVCMQYHPDYGNGPVMPQLAVKAYKLNK